MVARFNESATGINKSATRINLRDQRWLSRGVRMLQSAFPIGQSTSSIEQTDCQGGGNQQQECGVQRMQAQTDREAAFDGAVRQNILQRDLQPRNASK